MADPTRAEMVAAIRALADFIEERIDLPVPTSVYAQHSSLDRSSTRWVVTAAATALGVEPKFDDESGFVRHELSTHPLSVSYAVHGFLPADEAIVLCPPGEDCPRCPDTVPPNAGSTS